MEHELPIEFLDEITVNFKMHLSCLSKIRRKYLIYVYNLNEIS